MTHVLTEKLFPPRSSPTTAIAPSTYATPDTKNHSCGFGHRTRGAHAFPDAAEASTNRGEPHPTKLPVRVPHNENAPRCYHRRARRAWEKSRTPNADRTVARSGHVIDATRIWTCPSRDWKNHLAEALNRETGMIEQPGSPIATAPRHADAPAKL